VRRRQSGWVVLLTALAALTGCAGDPVPAAPVVVDDDAYPVINTFLLALEARDAAAIDPTVQTDPQIAGVPREDAVAGELAEHGGLRIDYFSVQAVIGEDEPDVGEFRAKVGPPDSDVTLSWAIKWRDGQWRVFLPPRQLAAARIG
jgi:hypothetical protein